MNGIRSSSNTVSLDGSNLIDVGSNNGLMASLNTSMVQEVKVQSSNFAAEFGTGGMNVSGVTKAGSAKFHGEAYDYIRDSKFAANDRSNSIAGTPKPKSKYQYPGGNVGGPITFGDSYTKNRDRLFFFGAFEVQRQDVDSGSRFNRTFSQAMRNGDFSELLPNRGSNLNSISQLRIPQGYPNAGQPAPNNDMRPYMSATRQVPGEPLSAAQLQRPEQSLQLRVQRARAAEPDGLQGPVRLEHQQVHEGLRPGRESEERREPARRVVGALGASRCPRPTSAPTTAARSPATSCRC